LPGPEKDRFDHYQFQKGKIFEIEKKLRPDFLQKFVKITSFKVRFSSKMYFLLRFFQNMYTIFFKIKKGQRAKTSYFCQKKFQKSLFWLIWPSKRPNGNLGSISSASLVLLLRS